MKINFLNFKSQKYNQFLNYINHLEDIQTFRNYFPISFNNKTLEFIWGRSNLLKFISNKIFKIKSFYFEEGLISYNFFNKKAPYSYFCCKDKPYFDYCLKDWKNLFKDLDYDELYKLSELLKKNEFKNGKIKSKNIKTNYFEKADRYIVGQIDSDQSLKKFSKNIRTNFKFIETIKKKFPNDNLVFLVHPKMSEKEIYKIKIFCYNLHIKIEDTCLTNPNYYNSNIVFHTRSSHLGLELFELGANVSFIEKNNNWIYQAKLALNDFINDNNKYFLRSAIIISTHFFPIVENLDLIHSLLKGQKRMNVNMIINSIRLNFLSEDIQDFGYDHLRIINKWNIKKINDNIFIDDINICGGEESGKNLVVNLFMLGICAQIGFSESQNLVFNLLQKIAISKIPIYSKLQSIRILDLLKEQINKNLNFEKNIHEIIFQYLFHLQQGKDSFFDVENFILLPLNYGFYSSSDNIIKIIEITGKNSFNNLSIFSLFYSIKKIQSFIFMSISYQKAFLTKSIGGDIVGSRNQYLHSLLDLQNLILIMLSSFKIKKKLISSTLLLMIGKVSHEDIFTEIKTRHNILNIYKTILRNVCYEIGLTSQILKNYEYLICMIGQGETEKILKSNIYGKFNSKLFIYYKSYLSNKLNIKDRIINNFVKKLVTIQKGTSIDGISNFIYNQPKIPPGPVRGIIVNLTAGCKNSQGMFYESLNYWTKKNFLAVDPFCIAGKLLPNVEDNKELSEVFKNLHFASRGLRTRRFKLKINLAYKEILYKDINLYQGIYERMSTYFRRYDINLESQEEQYQFNLELIRCYRFLTMHYEMEKIAKNFEVPVFGVIGNSHVSPYSVFRDMAKTSAYSLLLVGLSYGRLYSGKFDNYTQNYKISLYKNENSSRAPFLCSAEEFDKFIESKHLLKNYNQHLQEIENWLQNKFTKKENKNYKSYEKYLSWRNKYPNGRVFLVLGKVSVDLALPIDGGQIFRNYREYVSGISNYATENQDSFFIFRPHPHEKKKEIALSLNDFMSDWINPNQDNVLVDEENSDINEFLKLIDIILLYNGSSIMEFTAIGKKVAVFSDYGPKDYPLNIWVPKNLSELKSNNLEVNKDDIYKAKDLLIKYFFYDTIFKSAYFRFGSHNLSTYVPCIDSYNLSADDEKKNIERFDKLFQYWSNYN